MLADSGEMPSAQADRREPASVTVWTVGHGTRTIDAFVDLLRDARIERIVDVRSYPGSRRHPQFGREAIAASLSEAVIDYRWARDLGGFRKARPGSPHLALSHDGFRGYADHMQTPEFRAALKQLIQGAATVRSAVMCAESVWWRCHRRLLSDALLAAGADVAHVMDGGRLSPHTLSSMARVADGTVIYDVGGAEQQELPVSASE